MKCYRFDNMEDFDLCLNWAGMSDIDIHWDRVQKFVYMPDDYVEDYEVFMNEDTILYDEASNTYSG